MINKKFKNVLLLILVLNITIFAGTEKIVNEPKTVEKECSQQDLDSFINKYVDTRSNCKLNEMYQRLNKYYCCITKDDLKKYVISAYEKEMYDSSKEYYSKKGLLWMILILSEWDKSVENVVKKEMEYLKKKKDKGYYHRMSILIRYSESWYQYLEDMYYNLDSINADYDLKSAITRQLIERFGKSKDKIIHSKIESVFYALLIKEKENINFEFIDNYLSSRSDLYVKSRQRKDIFEIIENKVLEKNRMHRKNVEFFNKIKDFFNKNKKVTEYNPPLLFN